MLNNNKTKSARPLSPHLSIYKLQISSALSILHRLTGIALFFSLLISSWIFIFFSLGYEILIKLPYYHQIIKFSLIILTLMFFYHFFSGLRHLMWDSGRGFSIKNINLTGFLVIIFSIVSTIFLLFFI